MRKTMIRWATTYVDTCIPFVAPFEAGLGAPGFRGADVCSGTLPSKNHLGVVRPSLPLDRGVAGVRDAVGRLVREIPSALAALASARETIALIRFHPSNRRAVQPLLACNLLCADAAFDHTAIFGAPGSPTHSEGVIWLLGEPQTTEDVGACE